MKNHLPLPILSTLLLTLLFNNHLNAQCNSQPCQIPTPSADAQEACILPSPSALDCYYGATTPSIPVSFPPTWCTSIENNHFFAFTADAPTASFEICTFDCTQGNAVQAAILETSDCINFQFVSPCLGNIQSGSCQALMASGLNPGQVYYLMIDGSAGALCDYAINGAIPTIYNHTGTACIPSLSSSTYSTSTVSMWTILPPTAGSIQGNPISASVNIVWAEAGPAQVCAKSLSCLNAPTECIDIIVYEHVESTETVELCQNYTVDCAGQTFSSPGNYTVTLGSYLGCDSVVNCIVTVIPTVHTNESVHMCQGESVMCAGEEFFAPGNFPVTLPAYQGCDSVVHCIVSVVPTILVNLGAKYICEGSCFQVGDSLYCTAGSYVQILNSSLGCDSIVSFELVVLTTNNAANFQAPQGQTLTCANPSLSLHGINQPNLAHFWKNTQGDTLSTASSFTVNTPGNYIHQVVLSQGGTTCEASKKILIKLNNTPPPVTAMGGTLDATHPTVQLMGHSIISGVTYSWTGPNGFTSSQKKPIVSVPGFYTLTVTYPQTGCSNTITVEVIMMA